MFARVLLIAAWLCCCSVALITAPTAVAAESEEHPAPAEPPKAAPTTSPDRLDLGGGESLDLVAIPAGTFQMGAVEKIPESPWIGFSLLIGGVLILVLMIAIVGGRMLIRQETFRFSLAMMVVGALCFGVSMLGLVRWSAAKQAQTESFALANERPVHAVTLTKKIFMGKFAVTQHEYEQVMKSNFSYFQAPDKPVERVSWEEAAEFCKRVSAASGRTVRLPTEAEWEYACRAGTHTLYYCGDDPRELFKVAWFLDSSKNSTHGSGESAKSMKPNAFGLFDMHGNVLQWCQDWYDEGYYSVSPGVNPEGAASGFFRVVRGSSWQDPPPRCRASARNALRPDKHSYCVGFRVVVEE